jgi:dTDP-4-amino-4,6-dideoxygalactose transaminase
MEPIYITKPFLPPLEEYIEYLKAIWGNKILSNNGPYLKDFESRLSDFTGVSNTLCVTNGTLALQLAIRALGLKGEVITTPFTFVATSSALIWENCKPVYVDINPETLNIDTDQIEDKINKRTSAILPVHVFGNLCAIEKIKEIADRHHLKIIYDAAHAFGLNYKGRSIFSLGDISIASFHSTKIFHSIEGGAIFTDNKTIARKCKLLRNFGYENYKIYDVGINAKMNEFCAVMGILNLKYFAYCQDRRKRIFHLYTNLLKDNINIQYPRFAGENNYSYFPIILITEEYKKKVLFDLNSINIFPREYFSPSLETIFSKKRINCPIAHDISSRILCLPVSVYLHEDQVETICNIINMET